MTLDYFYGQSGELFSYFRYVPPILDTQCWGHISLRMVFF